MLLFTQGVDLQADPEFPRTNAIGVTSAFYVDVLREVQRDAVDRIGHLSDQPTRLTHDQLVRSDLRSG
jgi:hypothetical protein